MLPRGLSSPKVIAGHRFLGSEAKGAVLAEVGNVQASS